MTAATPHTASLAVELILRLSLFLVVACGNIQPARSDPRAPLAGGCPAVTRPVATVRLDDGRAIYVEPMAFARGGDSHVLAGEPLYVWKSRGTTTEQQLDSTDALIGAVFHRSGRVTPLPKPSVNGGDVTDIRLLADGDGYAAVFAQTQSRASQALEPTVLAYWFARTNGVRWDSLERLPAHSPEELKSASASELVRVGEELMFAVPFGTDAEQNVALYMRSTSGWSVETITTRGAAYVALTAKGTHPFLYVVRADTMLRQDANSLSLFRRVSGVWRDRGFVAHGSREPIHHPTVDGQRDRLTLSWIANDQLSGSRIGRAARLLADGTLGSPITLVEGVDDLVSVRGSSTSRWVASRPNVVGNPTLALVEWGAGEPHVRDAVVNPFRGPLLAYGSDYGDVVVGPVVGRSPEEEVVVSAVLLLASRCRVPT